MGSLKILSLGDKEYVNTELVYDESITHLQHCPEFLESGRKTFHHSMALDVSYFWHWASHVRRMYFSSGPEPRLSVYAMLLKT